MKIPNDFVDKYIALFSDAERLQAVMSLMKQCYDIGYADGEKQAADEIYG